MHRSLRARSHARKCSTRNAQALHHSTLLWYMCKRHGVVDTLLPCTAHCELRLPWPVAERILCNGELGAPPDTLLVPARKRDVQACKLLQETTLRTLQKRKKTSLPSCQPYNHHVFETKVGTRSRRNFVVLTQLPILKATMERMHGMASKSRCQATTACTRAMGRTCVCVCEGGGECWVSRGLKLESRCRRVVRRQSNQAWRAHHRTHAPST